MSSFKILQPFKGSYMWLQTIKLWLTSEAWHYLENQIAGESRSCTPSKWALMLTFNSVNDTLWVMARELKIHLLRMLCILTKVLLGLEGDLAAISLGLILLIWLARWVSPSSPLLHVFWKETFHILGIQIDVFSCSNFQTSSQSVLNVLS